MVSAGELGTDPRTLEAELQKILDIAHAWGAVLLLDEADVFLEKRTIQDIHRNALVSIFLRLLEYFQGILFLTTNRVETFDDAFQSRIHIALRYGELSTKAKKAVFKLFIERVRVLEGIDTMPFKEEDYNSLAKNNLNGRQVCCFSFTQPRSRKLIRLTDQKHYPHGPSIGREQQGSSQHGTHQARLGCLQCFRSRFEGRTRLRGCHAWLLLTA